MRFMRSAFLICSILFTMAYGLKICCSAEWMGRPIVSLLIKQSPVKYTRGTAHFVIRIIGKPAIPYLLENVSNTDSYLIPAVHPPISSFFPEKQMVETNVGIMSMYLIDAIISGKNTPHVRPRLWSEGPDCIVGNVLKTCPPTQEKAVEHYRQWWFHINNQDRKINPDKLPLDNTDTYWIYP